MTQTTNEPHVFVLHDFRNFLYLTWKHLGLPEPTPVQYDIADYLQHGGRRIGVEAYRGVGKSWITGTYALWCLLRDPQNKILVVSASKDRADAFTVFCRRLIEEMPILRHLKPREGKGRRDSAIAFDVGPAEISQSPSVKSVGITGQITGSRANIIIADDIETPKNSLTFLQRERLAELVKEFDAVLIPGGSIMYLGTPQCEMSLYNVLPERGYKFRIWPARYPSQKQIEGYGEKLAPWINQRLLEGECHEGDPVDPKRFSELDLQEREASYGRSGFSLQFMLDTSLSDAEKFPLKLADLIVMDLDPEVGPTKVAWSSSPASMLEDVPNVGLLGDRVNGPMFVSEDFTEYTGSVMAIDPSGRGSDEVGFAVVKMLHGRLFVLKVEGLEGGYSDANLQYLAKTASSYGVNDIIVESNFGDGMFVQLLRPWLKKHHACAVEEVRHSKQKELRIIDTMEPLMNQHRIVVDKQILKEDAKTEDKAYQLFYQMTRLTKERGALAHDDRLDALSIAVAFWVDHMSRDTDEAAEDWFQSWLDEQIEAMENSVIIGEIGKPKGPHRWDSW